MAARTSTAVFDFIAFFVIVQKYITFSTNGKGSRSLGKMNHRNKAKMFKKQPPPGVVFNDGSITILYMQIKTDTKTRVNYNNGNQIIVLLCYFKFSQYGVACPKLPKIVWI
jgi:hypothetical protein